MTEKLFSWNYEAWHKGWHIEMTDNKDGIFFPAFQAFPSIIRCLPLYLNAVSWIFVGLIMGGVICIVNDKYQSEMEGIYLSYTYFHQ